MGWLVLKVNPDSAEDRWCLWSTIVEAPVFDGTVEEMTRAIRREYGESRSRMLPEMIERAKVCGAGNDYDGDWDQNMIYMQQGFLPRLKLGELLDLYERNADEAEIKALLIPFEDKEG